MSYLIERAQAFLDDDILAILRYRRQAVRSRLVLRDGSLRDTLTRPGTLIRQLKNLSAFPITIVAGRRPRGTTG